eukprot:TRINITY_DN1264_c2_g5_i1.p1 TRINITY_DN1264_c2_g5~~TRINITY_DN1264_c2_g5_i1.p1  ORF type:complete len:676 (-),score=243.24 TRINITY_DN1264_c2_g5_i1:186-2213(-)
MTVLSKLATVSGGLSVICALAAVRLIVNKRVQKDKEKIKASSVAAKAIEKTKTKKEKIAIDKVFLKRLRHLIPILCPSVFSKEFFYIVLVAIMMLLRTYCDLWVIKSSTTIERTIISRNPKSFKKNLFYFCLSMIPIACVNNLLKYGLHEMSLCFRTRLTNYLFDEYLKGFTYYKISNLDNRISNPDQLLTQDVERFCQSLSDLYSNISKPILDIIIYARKLSGTIGLQGPSSMLGYLVFSGLFLTWLRRPVGAFTVQEQKLEGEFRFVNSRLITNSEEIAFYQGNEKEESVIKETFNRLMSHLRKSTQFRFSMGIVDSIVAKYLATVVGFYVVSRPFLNGNTRHAAMSHSELMEDYYRSGRMLMNLAQAVGRLVLAGRELTRLAGFTARVDELIDVLKDLNEGRYQRTMINRESTKIQKKLAHDNNDEEDEEQEEDNFVLGKPGDGKIIEEDHIINFQNVPLVTPNGDVLVKNLNFTVNSGTNVIVCGPNGCGKSSLFRILGELWPLFGGTLTKPSKENLFYVPQRPYMTLGTLRDQIAYPHSKEKLDKLGVTDDDLANYLDLVSLGYLVEREGGFDAVKDWMDVLSGGEKQRIAMARLFYHQPQFAILDECTSAVSVDVEGFMYDHCRKLGITLFTVSHRASLWVHHEYVLAFNGRGDYSFDEIDDNTERWGS